MALITVSSVLDAVTVYAQGAVCTRLARLPAQVPPNVRISGLPLTLREGSLRARVLAGPAGLSVTDVRAGFDAELPAEADLPAEQLALEQALDASGKLEVELSLIQRELSQVSSLRPAFLPRKKGEPTREAPVGAILELASFVDGEFGALTHKRLELERRLVDARNEVELRRNRLAEASSAKRTQRASLTRTALVSLAVPDQAGEAQLAIEYLVPGARWTPGYDLRLAPNMGSGSLVMRASIAQRSGEDWSRVRLAVSTAALDRRTEAPELKSLRVGRSQPMPARSGWRAPPPGLDELFGGYDEALRRRPAVQRPSRPAPQAVIQAVTQGHAVMADMVVGGAPEGRSKRAKESRPVPPPQMSMAPPPAPAFLGAPSGAMPRRAPAAKKQAMRSRQADISYDEEMAAPEMSDEADDFAAAPAESEPEPEPEPELELGGELLDYDVLALPEPEPGGMRGRLAPRRDSLRGLLVATSVSVQVDILVAALAQVRGESNSVEHLPLPPHAVPLRQSAGSYDYRYDAEHRVDIAGDGAWHTVPIGKSEVALSPRYVCVPSLEDRVYRSLLVRNGSSQALLAGGADVTLGNEFLMTVPFPAIAPQGLERVGLGVEESIKVSRNTLYNETTGGLLGGASVLSHEVKIEVANRLSHPAELEVRERVPVPAHEDIKVEEAQVEPPWKPDEGARDGVIARGARTWRVNLAANTKTSLSARYVIKLPSGKTLVGGNRRI